VFFLVLTPIVRFVCIYIYMCVCRVRFLNTAPHIDRELFPFWKQLRYCDLCFKVKYCVVMSEMLANINVSE